MRVSVTQLTPQLMHVLPNSEQSTNFTVAVADNKRSFFIDARNIMTPGISPCMESRTEA